MARYIFKPLITYLDGDSAEIREKFLDKYKESLMTGELMVDLTQYDIYISNAGFEFPIPITKDIREEIIDWIESDEGPMAKLKSSKLLNTSTSGSEISLIRKYDLIDKLLKEINIYRVLMFIKSDDSENQLRMIERECNVFYRDLSSYAITAVNTSTGGSKDIINIYNEIKTREQMLWKRYVDLKIKTNTLISDVYSFKKFNYEGKYNPNEKNLKDVLIDNFKTIINNSVKLNAKLNTSDFTEENVLNGNIVYTIKTTNGTFDIDLVNKINNFFYLNIYNSDKEAINGSSNDFVPSTKEADDAKTFPYTSQSFPFYPEDRDYTPNKDKNKYGPNCTIKAEWVGSNFKTIKITFKILNDSENK